MNRISSAITSTIFTLLAIPAYAQVEGAPVIEGHVFDRSTLRPLANVHVIATAKSPSGDLVVSSSALTDSNGFYSFVFAPQTVGANPINTLTALQFAINCFTEFFGKSRNFHGNSLM